MNRFPRQAHWAVPAGVAAAVVALTAGSLITVAQAAPGLPARTPAQLLAAVASTTAPPPPLTGTVTETASLGIPQIPGTQRPSSLVSLLTGTHTVQVWYADPQHVRLALPFPLGETDLIRNGGALWLWQSASDTVTRYTLPSAARDAGQPGPSPVPLTPQQAARQILAAVGPSTAVSVDSNLTVAGQPAYQLVLAPKDHRSLIGQVRLALDGEHPQLPLQVAVYARGATTPAFQVGYTSLSFAAPPASAFHFAVPRGATVHRAAGPGPLGGVFLPRPAAGLAGTPRSGRCVITRSGRPATRLRPRTLTPAAHGAPFQVVVPAHGCVVVRLFKLPPGARPKQLAVPAGLPRPCALKRPVAVSGLPQAPGAPAGRLPARLPSRNVGWYAYAPLNGRTYPGCGRWTGFAPGAAGGPQVIGKGWLSVAVLPASALSGLAGPGSVAGAAGQAARSMSGAGDGVGGAALLAGLLRSAASVHGAWGSGKLLHTSLVNVLITRNGRLFAGAVVPRVLFAAAAQVK